MSKRHAIAALMAFVGLLILPNCNRPTGTKPNPKVEQIAKHLSEGEDGYHDVVIINSVPNRFLGRMEAVAEDGDKEAMSEPAYLGTVFPNMIEQRTGQQNRIIGVIQGRNKNGIMHTILVTDGGCCVLLLGYRPSGGSNRGANSGSNNRRVRRQCKTPATLNAS